MQNSLLLLLCVCLLSTCCLANLDFSRVHLVDYTLFSPAADTSSSSTTTAAAAPFGNFIFRGNLPVNDTSFAYDELLSYMRNRTKEALNIDLPAQVYLIDISLLNIFDTDARETQFWQNAAANVGEFINWPLGFAGLLPPTLYNQTQQKEMALGPVWKDDQLPERIMFLRQMLYNKSLNNFGLSSVIFIHCTAGCDRTGEIVGSYRLYFDYPNTVQNVSVMYAIDAQECGRPPNYFSTNALEWFCLYQQYTNNQNLGECLHFATCKLFGSCTPINNNGNNDHRYIGDNDEKQRNHNDEEQEEKFAFLLRKNALSAHLARQH